MPEVSTASFLEDVGRILEEPGDARIAVAFITSPGIDEIRSQLLRKLESGNSVRMLIDLQEAATDPSALWDLVALASEHQERLQLRAYIPDSGILHAKVYIGVTEQETTVVTGSANLSRAAFHENAEHGARIAGAESDGLLSDTVTWFDGLWNSDKAHPVDEEAARLYELFCGRRRAVLNRARRRSRAAWDDLASHLASGPTDEFEWPSLGVAYMLGAITARGYMDSEAAKITIPLLFRHHSYSAGRIAVQGLSFDAADVLPGIPSAIAQQARLVFAGADVVVDGMRVAIDLSNTPDVFDKIEGLFVPQRDCNSFRLPRELADGDVGIVTEFVRGFAVASALLTDNTSMPRNPITGLPGQMVVWLRPKQANPRLFDELYELIRQRLGITVYRHQRFDRDPHLKIPCEEFVEVGFGIDWWDQLVNRGAEYNQAMFPQLPTRA